MNIDRSLPGLRDFARRVAHEGIVLLENKNHVLPLVNKKIALYGRIQTNYYKSGTGSGGLVNVTDVPSFVDAVLENPRLDLNMDVLEKYTTWIKDNPFNAGNGMWASEPWSQVEMDITLDEIESLKRNDEVAVMIIGRTAGEDRDNYYGEGSYLLSKTEFNVLKRLKQAYSEVVLILNVGNIIDLNFVKELDIDSVLLAWNGGQDGARATIDCLTGYISPSGKLPATIAKDLMKYPASKSFGNPNIVEYNEDIYVGYRFFETFMKDEVLYPFGYGLSYTRFNIELIDSKILKEEISLDFKVTNIGTYPGKETVQVYFEAPQGLLGKPKMQLIGFVKTKYLKPMEEEQLNITFKINNMASYDDQGLISKSSYVLEQGLYNIYFGNSVRDTNLALKYSINDNIIVKKVVEALAPFKEFERVKPKVINDELILDYELTPKRTINYLERIEENLPEEISKNDLDYKLIDVYNNKISLNEFIGSMSIDELRHIVVGEGMSSPRVTPGTASAFGGVTDELINKGIPTLCCADGPSGIRMDSGLIATSIPNGTLMASTFNYELITKTYELLGKELVNYEIDILLGPGMNIQRHPLNGRNFEYFSEDPLLTGIMASAVVKGLNDAGVYGAMKHFAANNQETARTKANSVVSERALREIYLKPYEIAVKSVGANVIMTSYNPINGIWAAGNYDLNTIILREEWGFDGIVMTDWWASMNNETDESSKQNLKSMIKAQNDLYMVTPNVKEFNNNILEELNKGTLKLSELQRVARNILSFILKSQSFRNKYNIDNKVNKDVNNWFKTNKKEIDININAIKTTYKEKFNNINNYDLIETKNDITYALKDNILEVYGLKEKVHKNEFNEILSILVHTNKYHLPTINWHEIEFDLNDAYINYSTDSDFNQTKKDSIYTFPINVEVYGKYIVDLKISSNQESTVQMPFSIYIDNINKQTVSTNGTNGEIIGTNAHIIIEPKNKFISFKFHKTGIKVHSIKIIKHG